VCLALQEPRHSKFSSKGLGKGAKTYCRRSSQNGSDIHSRCFQRDGTRHVTIWEGSLTVQQTRNLEFSDFMTPKNESCDLPISGLTDWQSGVYLKVSAAGVAQLCDILEDMDGLPVQGRKCDHISLYRPRNAPKEVRSAAFFQNSPSCTSS
jgi:hypothetical protein